MDKKALIPLSFAIAALGVAGWLFLAPMRHVIHLRNASTSTPFTVGVALDNQPDVYFERRLGGGDTQVLEFSRRAEAGYIFYAVQERHKVELGRCGYTDRSVNEYEVVLAPGYALRCSDKSRDR